MKRLQFTFYRSYYDAIKVLPKKEQTAVLLALCAYALDKEEPNLTGTAGAIFTLIRPTLDSGWKKAIGGTRGTPQKDNEKIAERCVKDTAKEKEGEKEKEVEIEIEKEDEYNPPTPFAAVISAYMDRINPQPSEICIGEIKGFVEQMGAECCLRAIQIAQDNRVTRWNYVKQILQSKREQGVTCLADWDASEEKRKQNVANENPNSAKVRPSFAEIAAKMEGKT